jgi:hypothetical protein
MMTTQQSAVEVRDAFLQLLHSELERWRTAVRYLEAEERHLKPAAKLSYHHQVQALENKLNVIQRKADYLHLAEMSKFDPLKIEIEGDIARFEQELERLQTVVNEARHEALTWGRGMTENHAVESIGWAEGQAEEQMVTSSGWPEGQAEKHESSSIGWPEGQAEEEEEEEEEK